MYNNLHALKPRPYADLSFHYRQAVDPARLAARRNQQSGIGVAFKSAPSPSDIELITLRFANESELIEPLAHLLSVQSSPDASVLSLWIRGSLAKIDQILRTTGGGNMAKDILAALDKRIQTVLQEGRGMASIAIECALSTSDCDMPAPSKDMLRLIAYVSQGLSFMRDATMSTISIRTLHNSLTNGGDELEFAKAVATIGCAIDLLPKPVTQPDSAPLNETELRLFRKAEAEKDTIVLLISPRNGAVTVWSLKQVLRV
jgi:hypothetical protein